MDWALFGELPRDLVRTVLTFTSVPDLCRFRTVSREWNELISNVNFAVDRAKKHANCQDPSFIVLHYIRSSTARQTELFDCGWCVLDMKARRWYRIAGSAHGRHVLVEPNIPVAMDGGLVCQFLKTECNDDISLIVHNPTGNYAKILPLVPKHESAAERPGLSLVFDTIAKIFQVFVINHNYDQTIKLNDPRTSEEERQRIRNDPVVRVYDSATNEWHSLRNPDWNFSDVGYLLSSVIFQGHLVVLFSDTSQLCGPLWTYSLAEKRWDNTQPELLDDIYRYDTKLAVSANRLFLVSQFLKGSPNFSCWLSLEEIKIPEVTLERVCILSKEQVVSWFDIRLGIPNDPTLDELDSGMIVMGFGNSCLVVMYKSSGKCKVFDVVTRTWNADDLPHNPLSQLPDDQDCEWAGKHMNLLPLNWELTDLRS